MKKGYLQINHVFLFDSLDQSLVGSVVIDAELDRDDHGSILGGIEIT
jgi:hypothetical protein